MFVVCATSRMCVCVCVCVCVCACVCVCSEECFHLDDARTCVQMSAVFLKANIGSLSSCKDTKSS